MSEPKISTPDDVRAELKAAAADIYDSAVRGENVSPPELRAAMLAIATDHRQLLVGARVMMLVSAVEAGEELLAAGVERRHAIRALSVEAFNAATFLSLAAKRLDGEPFSPARLALFAYAQAKDLAERPEWSDTLELAGELAKQSPGVSAAMGARVDAEVAEYKATAKVLEEIEAERRRQIAEEGWTPERDDAHPHGAMARAAACYAISGAVTVEGDVPDWLWPWEAHWWKPRGDRRDLVRAAALIVAEIERLDRAEASDEGR